MDVTGKADPYVVVKLMNNGKVHMRHRTQKFFNTLDAVFNESFPFQLPVDNSRLLGLEIKVKVNHFCHFNVIQISFCPFKLFHLCSRDLESNDKFYRSHSFALKGKSRRQKSGVLKVKCVNKNLECLIAKINVKFLVIFTE